MFLFHGLLCNILITLVFPIFPVLPAFSRIKSLKDAKSALPVNVFQLTVILDRPAHLLDSQAMAKTHDEVLPVSELTRDEVRPGKYIGSSAPHTKGHDVAPFADRVAAPAEVLCELSADHVRTFFPEPVDYSGIETLDTVIQCFSAFSSMIRGRCR